jgi:hypothetical protein
MRGMPYKKSPTPNPPQVSSSVVREALELQAARRPPKSPPRQMPVTPTLPRIRKGKPRNQRKP